MLPRLQDFAGKQPAGQSDFASLNLASGSGARQRARACLLPGPKGGALTEFRAATQGAVVLSVFKPWSLGSLVGEPPCSSSSPE